MVRAMKFLEFCFSVDNQGSIKFEELEADFLGINPGDGFMSFVDPVTKEVTLRKVDLTNVVNIGDEEWKK